MEQKIINSENVKESEVTDYATRVKSIILNSKNEILLVYSYGSYMFPGGHLEGDEPLIPGLNRELKEETGLDFGLEESDIKPFYSIVHYSRNYRGTDSVRKNIIYYYYLKTDTLYDKDNLHLDKVESKGDFKLLYIPYDEVEEVLVNSIPDNEMNKIIVEEMLEVLNILKTRSVIVYKSDI